MTARIEKGGFTGWVGGRVPGGLDAESDVFDKSVALLYTQIRKLTRTPGEGSMSDFETRLSGATKPERTDTPEGRREAIAGLRALVKELRSGYSEMLGGDSAIVDVRTRAEAEALPHGTRFRDPSGTVRTRQ